MAVPGVARGAGRLARAAAASPAAPTPPRRATRRPRPATRRSTGVAVGLLVTSTALRHLVGASFAYFLPNLLTGRGLSLTAAGAVVTAFLVAAALGMYAGGATGDRFGNARVSIVGLVASVPPLLLALGTHGPLAIGALLLGSALLSVQNAPGVALVQSLLPRNLGAALGLINGVAFGIGSVGVALVGLLVTRSGAAVALARGRLRAAARGAGLRRGRPPRARQPAVPLGVGSSSR